ALPISTATYANKVEEKIAQFWSELLGVRQPDPDADFFDLGGHSLDAVRLFAKIRKEYATDLPLATLFQAPTLRLLANMVIQKGNLDVADTAPAPGVEPLYLVHGAGGYVLNVRALSGYLDTRLTFYALRALGSDCGTEIHETIEVMAACCVCAVLNNQPEGPYNLAGYSGGGVIA